MRRVYRHATASPNPPFQTGGRVGRCSLSRPPLNGYIVRRRSDSAAMPCVAITGGPGVGKTTLLAELRRASSHVGGRMAAWAEIGLLRNAGLQTDVVLGENGGPVGDDAPAFIFIARRYSGSA